MDFTREKHDTVMSLGNEVTPLNLVTRAEWGAAEPKNFDPLNTPVKYFGWSETVTYECETKEECCKIVKFVQTCNMEKHNLADIKHNFLVSKDGTIYEGRGWYANAARTDPKHNTLYGGYITIARIGMDIDVTPPTEIEIEAQEKILRHGVEAGYLHPFCKNADVLRHYGS